jgi:energy-coupling factor transporter ATP-binding protein EcfA2
LAGIGKRTIILTTHQAHLGAPIADTTLTMRAGKIDSVVQLVKREPAV